MNNQIIVDLAFVIGGVCWIFIPFERKRVRAQWAKAVFVSMGILGFVKGITCLFLDAHWSDFSEVNHNLIDNVIRFMYNGFFLGVVLSLILSGQFRGVKKQSLEQKQIPN
jgi:hypothetical protein